MKSFEEQIARFFRYVNQPVVEQIGAGRNKPMSSDLTMEQILARGSRLMYIAAHPDDETFASPILSFSSLIFKNPLFLLVLTRGEGGECSLPDRSSRSLAEIRADEMRQVANLYGAVLRQESFLNASLPMASFPMRHEIAARWTAQGNPVRVVAESIRSFKPDIIVTFAPIFGYTGHPEHQLAARFALSGIREAASPLENCPWPPHRVSHTYYLLNRYWFMKIWGRGYDHFPWTEIWDLHCRSVHGESISDIMIEHALIHRSQRHDMQVVKKLAVVMRYIFLYRVDPLREYWDPFEP